MLALLLALQQAVPTVGDTIWLTRRITVPADAEVRPATWRPEGDVTLLGRAVVRREGTSVIVAYPAVAWHPGQHTVVVPGPVVISADGHTDSLPPESRTLSVASVLPGSARADSITPQPPAGIVLEEATAPLLALLPLAIAAALFAPLTWWWRRRRPPEPPPLLAPRQNTVPVGTWTEAGESRAAAAATARALRQAVTAHLPGAVPGLVNSRLSLQMESRRPPLPAAEVSAVLTDLELAGFSEGAPADVLALAARADALRRRLEEGLP